MERFEDLVKFITNVDTQQDGLDPQMMDRKMAQRDIVPTGMSHVESEQSDLDLGERGVYIPKAFTRTRKQKMHDQNDMLGRLQGIMSDCKK